MKYPYSSPRSLSYCICSIVVRDKGETHISRPSFKDAHQKRSVMSNPQYVWRVNKRPRFTVLEFGELMAADDGPRETLLRDSKYERLYRSIGYRDVNRTVRRYLSSATRSRTIILDGRDALEQRKESAGDPKELTNIDLQIAALDAFDASLNTLPIAGLEFEAVGNRLQRIKMEDVEISVFPTVWVRQRRTRGRDQLGALIIDPAMGTALKTPQAIAKDQRAKEVACSLLHVHVSSARCAETDVASNDHCMIFHVHRRRLYTSPTAYKRDLKNMEAVCRWAMDRWDRLSPPPSFDPAKARYR